jgi:hypothetical protein
MADGGGARLRFGRIMVLGTLLGLASVAGLFGPRLWDAASAPGGTLARLKRRWDTWRGIAQWKDPHIRSVVNNLDHPPRAGTKSGTKTAHH